MKRHIKTFLILTILPIIGIFSYNFWSEYTYSGLMSPVLKQLKIPLNQDKIFTQTEPDLPDEQSNNKTIAGIDSNSNSIRDDIDIWINRSSGEYPLALSMRNYAKLVQFLVIQCKDVDPSTKNILENLEINLEKMNYKNKSNPKYFSDKLKILTLNTSERKKCFKY